MSETQGTSESDLIREGLASYWDVKYAVKAFEGKIQLIARAVLTGNLDGLKVALSQESIAEDDISQQQEDCQLCQVAIGAAYGWEWGLRLGIGWRANEATDGPEAVASLNIRTGAQYRRDRILSALKKALLLDPQPNVFVDSKQEWPYEVAVWSQLPSGAAAEEIRENLTTIFDCFVRWSKQAGGLPRALNDET
jgi:hypothetical protein